MVEITTGAASSEKSRPRWIAWWYDDEKSAVYLMTAFLFAWLAIIVVIQFSLVVKNDGLGVTKQHRVPADVVERVGVGDDFQKIMDATNKDAP